MDALIANLMDDMQSAPDDAAGRERFRAGFARLRSRLPLHPPAAARASETYAHAASTARGVAVDCLPLALAIVMHLYPLCALQCVPLPWMSRAMRRRARLVRTIGRDGLLLANAGSERAIGTNPPLYARKARDGIRVDGVFEYVSLASVANLVLFEAPLADGSGIAFCAADLRADSVQMGPARFCGGMRLSDTRSVTFVRHHVPRERCFVVSATSNGLRCIRDYQRCWFHLLLAEIHLARIGALQRIRNLEMPREAALDRSEFDSLRKHCLRLIDAPFAPGNLELLSRMSADTKLRVSQFAQSVAAQLRTLEPAGCADAEELMYMRMQPTADMEILRRPYFTARHVDTFAPA